MIPISVRGLGKKYQLGATVSADTLRDHIMQTASRLFGRGNGESHRGQKEEFWALKDVSFDVHQGDVLGVIGSNGAGKSTLLKILTGITEPTEGEVRLRGRVGSLLEVGTGFHQELTGRENIFMNGAILGMTRAEIKAKFDEIVAFSGVEQFLDTPVKRYSSGMRIRLGFAVAAHLEPEILLVDEVLAVGDIAFQKKCLGKMEEVAEGGRTVLFVSHNMTAMSALCSRAILLAAGHKCADGDANAVIDRYRRDSIGLADILLSDRSDRAGNGRLRFTKLDYATESDLHAPGQWISGRPGYLSLSYNSPDQSCLKNVNIAVTFYGSDGSPLFVCDNCHVDAVYAELRPAGRIVCKIPKLPLAPGRYCVQVWASVSGEVADYIRNAGIISVVAGDFYGTGRATSPSKHGPFLLEHRWEAVDS
jgi:lipopolysaccharide transport system ATP-binding protein